MLKPTPIWLVTGPALLLMPMPLSILPAPPLIPMLFVVKPPMALLPMLLVVAPPPLPKLLVKPAPVPIVEAPDDVSVVNEPVLPEIGVFEIAPPVIVALFVVNELSVARPEVVSVVKVVLPVTPSVPASVVAPEAPSVVKEPVPPTNEPALIAPVVVMVCAPIAKLSPTLIGVPFGLPFKFVVLTVVNVPIGTLMLAKVAAPVLVTFHELLLPTTSLPVPGAPPLIVMPLIAPVGNNEMSRPVISPAPFTRNEPAVFWKLPAFTKPVSTAVPPKYVAKFAVVPVMEFTVTGPVKFDEPLTDNALPGPGAVTANATPAPVFVTPRIPVDAADVPVNCEPTPVVPFELIVPVALIDVGAPVMLIPSVVALSEIPVANGSTLIPVPAPAPVTFIPPVAPAGALIPMP